MSVYLGIPTFPLPDWLLSSSAVQCSGWAVQGMGSAVQWLGWAVQWMARVVDADMKKTLAPPARRGNILDGWGTFGFNMSAVLSHCEVCRKLRFFYKVVRGKNGIFSPRNTVMTH